MPRSPQRPSTIPDTPSYYNRLLSVAPASSLHQYLATVFAPPTARFPLPLSRFPPVFGEAHPQVAPEKGPCFLTTPPAAEDQYYGRILCL